ncbi:DUF1446 domain-containing protein [soil metagenome]
MRRPIRVANFSGATGDHVGAFAEVVHGAEDVDVAIGDYLAEITMAMVAAGLDADAERLQAFHVPVFLAQLTPELATVAERGIKVVVNAGAFDPAGLADRVRQGVAEAGVDLRVAHVEGDDLLARVPELVAAGQLAHLDTGAPADSVAERLLAANAYLGGWGITAALQAGADIVVAGRVADANLVSGPAAWWHGWSPGDLDALAGAVAAGHVIECGPQAVGGNFAGFTDLFAGRDSGPYLRRGFPIAEIAGDGSCVVTKRAGEGGAVSVDTVTAQLVYEIQGPRYLNPDVVLHVDSLTLADDGPDRVRMSGARGTAAPSTTKVACFVPDGHRVVLMAMATGLDIDAKTGWLRDQMETVRSALDLDAYDFTVLGRPADDPASQAEATVVVRIAAAAAEPATLQRLSAGFSSFGLGGMPGFYGELAPRAVQRRIDYWPGLVEQSLVEHVAILPDGSRVAALAAPTAPFLGQPSEAATLPAYDGPGETRRVPLGRVAYARTGDKGGNANLGVWTPRPEAWPWLASYLTAERVAELLAVPDGVRVVRYPLPLIHGLEFVLHGYFGRSGSSNIGLDQIGKAVGEFLRARDVEVPVALLGPAGE